MSRIMLAKWVKKLRLIFIVFFSVLIVVYSSPVQAGWYPFKNLIENPGKNLGEEAAKRLAKAIEEGIKFDFDFDDRDIRQVFIRTRGLVGYATAQGQALTSHVGREYRDSISLTMAKLDNYTTTLDEIAGKRIEQLDKASEARIRQILEGIQKQTLLLSSEMTRQILAIEEAVKSSSSVISSEVQEITRTAGDELAEILGITKEHTDYLLNSTEKRLLNILSIAGDEVADLVKLTSAEIQENIKLVSQESKEFSIVTFDKLNEVTQDLTRVAGNELRVVLAQLEGISRVLIADSAGHAIDVTDNLSDEMKEVIEVGAENLVKLASHVTKEVLIINEALKESSLQVIEGGLFFVDRTADVILAIGSTGAGLFFLFISSYGFTKSFLKERLPESHVQRVIVFSFMGATIFASFIPFVFSLPSARAQVLKPMGLTKAYADVVPGVGKRMRREYENQTRQLKNNDEGLNNESCKIFAIENVRYEPSSERGNETVIATGSERNPLEFEVTGKQTAGGWIEVLTSRGQEAWVYENVTSNLKEMEDCLDDNDISVITVPDLIPKSREPRNPPPTVLDTPQSPNPLPSRQDVPPEESNSSSTNYSISTDFSKQHAIDLVKAWLRAKPDIFAPPFDRSLVDRYVTGTLHNDITKPNGSIDWLRSHNYRYSYENFRIIEVESFYNSATRPELTLLIYQEQILYTPNGIDSTESGISTKRYTYFFSNESGVWKIEDYKSAN